MELVLGVRFVHDGHSYELGSTYADIAGNQFRLDVLRMVFSAPYGVDDYGAVVANFPEACLLVDASVDNVFPLGELTSHHLHEIRFDVGLSTALDQGDTDNIPSLSNVTSMLVGGTGPGHYFLIIGGQVDGNNDEVLDADDPWFSYKCMGAGMLRQAAAAAHADVPESGPLTVEVLVDVAKLLADLNFLTIPSATGGHPVNIQLMDQLAGSMEHGH